LKARPFKSGNVLLSYRPDPFGDGYELA